MKEKLGIIKVQVADNCKNCMFADHTAAKECYCRLLKRTMQMSGKAEKPNDCPIIEVPDSKCIEFKQSGVIQPDLALSKFAEMNYANGWNDFRSKIATAPLARVDLDVNNHSTVMHELKETIFATENEKVATSAHKRSFDKAVAHLKQYIVEYQSALVPQGYVCQDGYKLGAWVKKMRGIYHGSKNVSGMLTNDDIEELNELGMVWDVMEYQWQVGYDHAESFYRVNHNLNIPSYYKDPEDGYNTGYWLQRQRYAKLTQEHAQKLSKLCQSWKRDLDAPAEPPIRTANSKDTQLSSKIQGLISLNGGITEINGDLRVLRWEEGYTCAKEYYSLCNNLVMNNDYTTNGGFPLGEWLHRRRLEHDAGKLSRNKKESLDKIGMIWNEKFATSLHFENTNCEEDSQAATKKQKTDHLLAEGLQSYSEQRWQLGYEHAKEYYSQNNDLTVPTHFICNDGYKLGSWIQNQRQARRSMIRGVSQTGKKNLYKISSERIELLDKIAMQW